MGAINFPGKSKIELRHNDEPFAEIWQVVVHTLLIKQKYLEVESKSGSSSRPASFHFLWLQNSLFMLEMNISQSWSQKLNCVSDDNN